MKQCPRIFAKHFAWLLLVTILLGATRAMAADCGPYKVLHVQAQPGAALIHVTGPSVDAWKAL